MKILTQAILFLLPWRFRRIMLQRIFGFKIHRTAKIGFSIVLADEVILDENANIGNLNLCKNIGLVWIKENSSLGNLNYITGFPKGNNFHFSHVPNRQCTLSIGKHSAITSRHFIDCTAGFFIGDYSTFAGVKSQVLTHSIDLKKNRQDAEQILIGSYCFVGTGSILLKGSKLPDYSVLGAGSLLNKNFTDEQHLYGGVPAKKISAINMDEYSYFTRKEGFVF